MTEQTQERRRFTRFAFDARAELQLGGRSYAVRLEDIALRGFLIRQPEGFEAEPGAEGVLEVHLDGDEVVLTLPARLVRLQLPYLGFACGHLELDTITHLRRLVELNLGDQALLDRELEQLLAPA